MSSKSWHDVDVRRCRSTSEAVGRRACEKLTAPVAGPHPASPSRPAAGRGRRGLARPGRQRRRRALSWWQLASTAGARRFPGFEALRGAQSVSCRARAGLRRRPVVGLVLDGFGRRRSWIDASAWPSAMPPRLVTRINPTPSMSGFTGSRPPTDRVLGLGPAAPGPRRLRRAGSPPPLCDVGERR
jgi:hypothetical protein